MMRTRFVLLGAFAFCLSVNAAEPSTPDSFKPAPLFRDHAVLQRNKPVPVWGRAVPGTKVVVEFKGHRVSATADASGRWEARLPAMPAGAEPADLTITTADKTVILHDVVVGDVWLCSGQSNMEWKVSEVTNAEAEISAADFPLIREFRTPLAAKEIPQTELAKGDWAPCSPKTVKSFSAVAYFFARDIHRELNVPVGIINTSWGGKMIEVFMSDDAVKNSGVSAAVESRWNWERNDWLPARMPEYEQKVTDKKAGKNVTVPMDPRSVVEQHRPGCVFNGMINPVIPYAIQGMLWYQGEHNISRPEEYSALLSAMITDLRTKFGQGDFPFYYVQLANFAAPMDKSGVGYSLLREAQTETLKVPNTGMAVTVDIGTPGNVHPRNKQDVGARLARIAKAKTYNLGGEYSGPVFSSATVHGSIMRINFDHPGNGLTTNSTDGLGFEIAGSNGVFYAAQTELSGAPPTNVLLSSTNVTAPVSVRYAWGNDPKAGLYNDAGNGVRLPAVPFCFSVSGSGQ